MLESTDPEVIMANAFNQIIGFEQVKDKIKRKTITEMETKKLQERQNVPRKSSKKPVFLLVGNPGTGKTCVAQIIGSIMHAMGLVTSNTFETITQSSLGPANGGKKFLEELETKVAGGTLFIDELHDFDRSTVFQKWLRKVAGPDYENPPLIILAGYPAGVGNKKNVDTFLAVADQGLHRRCTRNRFNLPDYTVDEIAEIFFTNVQRGHKHTGFVRYCLDFTPEKLAELMGAIPKSYLEKHNADTWTAVFDAVCEIQSMASYKAGHNDHRFTLDMLKLAITDLTCQA